MCKLHKFIYGLKQTSHSWNRRFDQTIKTINFDQNEDEPCVYQKTQGNIVVFLVQYVNDSLLIRNDVELLLSIMIWLLTQFQMKDLGEAQYIIRIKVLQDHKNRKILLFQATYIDKFLVNYVMQDSKKSMLPFKHEVPFSKDQGLKYW